MKRFLTFTILSGLALAGFLLWRAPSAYAFNGNNLMDDGIFNNSGSMGAGQINNWLNSNFPNSCISPNSGFEARVPSGYSPSGGFTYGGFASAGQVIATSAQVYGINPQVLLATLQKEQSLVAGGGGYCNDGSEHKYAAAMGYGCPDGGTVYSWSGVSLYRRNGVERTSTGSTCVNSAAKAGFSQQVIRAAWLLKFGEQRSKGNTGWAVIGGSWDNSDDPYTCYGGPMTQGYRKRCSSDQNATYYDGYITIDGSATHMDTGATAALYWYTPHFHGNQNFVSLFSQWFGDTTLPYAFKSSSSPDIYYYVDGFKVLVPAMGVLQDYGISPQSIQTLSQSQVDSIPSPGPGDGISPSLSYLVKSPDDADADGGSVYLVTVGKKYQFQSMQQFFDFGFSESNIGYLPLSFLQSIPGTSQVLNFVTSPYGSVFQVTGGRKKLIFDYQTYISLNPSDIVTPASYYTVSLVPSGAPLSNRDILVKYSNDEAVYLFDNNSYYSVPTFDAYTCWGFESTLNTPVYRLPDNSYIPTISPLYAISCLVKNGSNLSLMSKNIKYSVPPAYGLTRSQTDTQDIISLSSRLPAATAPLKQYIKPNNDAGIWFLTGGVRKVVPTYANFTLLGLGSGQFDVIDGSVFSSITANGIKLGNGKAVKTDNSAAVYGVFGNSRLLYATSDDFLAYRNNWSDIETYSAAILNQDYPHTGTVVDKYLYDQSTNKVYLVDRFGCYSLDSPALLSAYNKDVDQVSANQPYTSSAFPFWGGCQSASVYVKQNDSPVVYLMEGGNKRRFATWNALVAYSGTTNPRIIPLSASTIATFPLGAIIN